MVLVVHGTPFTLLAPRLVQGVPPGRKRIVAVSRDIQDNALMSELILGIETSGRCGSIALCCGDECLAERSLERTGRRHARTLVTEVDDVLRQSAVTARDCHLVAVSIGPGSFTGLRVGVVFAKTFAYATGASITAVDTLQCVAQVCPAEVSHVYAIANAQRNELFVGDYVREEGDWWVRQGDITIEDADVWCAQRSSDDVVTGPGVEKIEERLSSRCRLLESSDREPRASIVALLGARHLLAGQLSDAWSLEPFYLRRSAAEEKWEKDAHGTL